MANTEDATKMESAVKIFEEIKESLDKYIVFLEHCGCDVETINNQKMVSATYLYMTRALFTEYSGDYFSQKLEAIQEDGLRILDDWKPKKQFALQNKRAIVERICSSTDIIHFTEENVKTTKVDSTIWVPVLQQFNLSKRTEKELVSYFCGLFRQEKGYIRGLLLCMIELHKELCKDCEKPSSD